MPASYIQLAPEYNMAPAATSGIESLPAGWETITSCTLHQATNVSRTGSACLGLTKTAGQTYMSARPTPYTLMPVTVGETYTAVAWFRAATIARSCTIWMDWTDAAGNHIGGGSAVAANTTTGWTKVSRTEVAPAGVAYARPSIQINSVADGEVHYMDDYSVVPSLKAKRLRTRQRDVGSDTVEEQFLAIGAEPTYYVQTGPLAPTATPKYFLTFINTAGSGQTLKVRRLFIQNSQLLAIASGVTPATVLAMEFQVRRATASTLGTNITANPMDTAADGVLTNYTCVHTAGSVTEGELFYSWYTNNDEIGLTGAFPQAMYQQAISSLIDGWELRELTLEPGEGFTVKQITSTTLGSFNVLAVISKEL